jgi:SAM-dependent MidA family methyltransferase
MAAALYHPRLGYYARLRGFGAHGDFITSPETHPAFGFLLARQAVDLWEALGRPRPFRILEWGAGSGALARSMLDQLPAPSYTIQETSPSLREVQRRRLVGYPVSWHVRGRFHLILANEVVDAQPVHRVVMRDGRLRELLVGLNENGFCWIESDQVSSAIETYFAHVGVLPPEGGVAEINLELPRFVEHIARRVQRGMALILDYGNTADQLFRRSQGTLLTYYKHTMGSDPLARLGEQDISIQVDFTSLVMAARSAGLQIFDAIRQRGLLRNLGIDQLISAVRSPTDRQALSSLIDPNGLGRLIALFLGRDLSGYTPVGLSGKRVWPEPTDIPLLPPDQRDEDFLSQWREAFS